MKPDQFRNYLPEFIRNEGEVIATFGQARLVKTPEFKYELRGGSHEEQLQAHEWISLFMNHVVIRQIPAHR